MANNPKHMSELKEIYWWKARLELLEDSYNLCPQLVALQIQKVQRKLDKLEKNNIIDTTEWSSDISR